MSSQSNDLCLSPCLRLCLRLRFYLCLTKQSMGSSPALPVGGLLQLQQFRWSLPSAQVGPPQLVETARRQSIVNQPIA